jgi:hypothetical protein
LRRCSALLKTFLHTPLESTSGQSLITTPSGTTSTSRLLTTGIGSTPIAFSNLMTKIGGGRRAQTPINVSRARSAAWHAPVGYWSGWGGMFEYAWPRGVHVTSLTNRREIQLARKERSAPLGTLFAILSTSRLTYPKLPSHFTPRISTGYDKSFTLAAPDRASSTSFRISGASVTDSPLSSTL